MNKIIKVVLIVVLTFGDFFCTWKEGFVVTGVSVEEDLTLTKEEKNALDRFKPRVIPRLAHDYMKTDIYLIRWLRARKLNQQQAEKMLMDAIRWRKENNIDKINSEDWTEMTEELGFSYTTSSVDKAGRPIGMAPVGTWNIRRAALTGRLHKASRFFIKCMEEATQLVVQKQLQGKNVTQWKVLFDVEGFNVVQHACPLCLSAYVSFIHTLEARYPGFVDQIIAINIPPSFQIIIDAIVPLMSERTQKSLRLFGTDRKQWEKYLDKEIERDQRPPEFGGNKEEY